MGVFVFTYSFLKTLSVFQLFVIYLTMLLVAHSYIASNDMVINELEMICKEAAVDLFRLLSQNLLI